MGVYVCIRESNKSREARPAYCQANRGAATEPIKDYYTDDLLMVSVQWVTEVCGWAGEEPGREIRAGS